MGVIPTFVFLSGSVIRRIAADGDGLDTGMGNPIVRSYGGVPAVPKQFPPGRQNDAEKNFSTTSGFITRCSNPLLLQNMADSIFLRKGPGNDYPPEGKIWLGIPAPGCQH